jgi:DNA-3-methyladenine glycosylase II
VPQVQNHQALQKWLGLSKPPDYDGVRRLIAKWEPYAGLIYFQMLLYRLSENGTLNKVGLDN